MTTQMITSIEELTDLAETGLYARWSRGPERDAECGWTSQNHGDDGYEWQGEELVNIGGGYEEDGLSVVRFDDLRDLLRWQAEAWSPDVLYLLNGRYVGDCSDGEPLVDMVEPVAIVAPELVTAIRNS